VALIVAPATGAESYISVADADTYHASRGNAAWAAIATTAIKEQCLRRATDYMTAEYGARWASGYGDLTTDTVPDAIANACAELALKANAAELAPDIGRAKTRVKVDVIETEYSEFSSQVTTYRAIDRMLRPYLIAGLGGGAHKALRK